MKIFFWWTVGWKRIEVGNLPATLRGCRALRAIRGYRMLGRSTLLEELHSNRWADHAILPVISDPDDPKFDLEAYLTLSEAK